MHLKGLKDRIKEPVDRVEEIGANAAVPVNAPRRSDGFAGFTDGVADLPDMRAKGGKGEVGKNRKSVTYNVNIQP